MKFEEMLNLNGVKREESIFLQSSDELMNFDLLESKGLYSPCEVHKEQCLSLQPTAAEALQKNILTESEEYHLCCHELERIFRELKKASDTDENIHFNRIQRKKLQQKKKQLEEYAAEQSRKQLFGIPSERKTICFKNSVYATSISSLCDFLPQLNSLPMKSRFRSIPVFTDHIAKWKKNISEGHKFAVEGGPCLFGADEAYVKIKLRNGNEYTFDFVTEHEITGKTSVLSEFAKENAGMGDDISFCFYKTTLTEAEYQSLVYVFEIAESFGVDAYIPLPDFSYEKYMDNIMKLLFFDEKKNENARMIFHNELCRVTDLYLKEIQILKKDFSEIRIEVIHARNVDSRRIYKEKRKSFINYDSHMIKTLTTKKEKQDSIIDYITMPALPYYLNGVTDIIQVDCIDETDSYRKCQKLHRGVITLYPFLYPEELSKDGKNTVYYAQRRFKNYRKENKQI